MNNEISNMSSSIDLYKMAESSLDSFKKGERNLINGVRETFKVLYFYCMIRYRHLVPPGLIEFAKKYGIHQEITKELGWELP